MCVTCNETNVANDWFVDHNVLSQITCAERIVRMKIQVGPRWKLYYYCLLFPEQDFNTGTEFEGIPVVNHP